MLFMEGQHNKHDKTLKWISTQSTFWHFMSYIQWEVNNQGKATPLALLGDYYIF